MRLGRCPELARGPRAEWAFPRRPADPKPMCFASVGTCSRLGKMEGPLATCRDGLIRTHVECGAPQSPRPPTATTRTRQQRYREDLHAPCVIPGLKHRAQRSVAVGVLPEADS